MKKFSGISRIFLILSSFGFFFIFNSCSDLLSNSSGTVSVSLGSEVFQRALSEDQLQDLGFTSYRLEVSIKGDYEARQERIWTSTELLETAGNNEGLFTEDSTDDQIAEILAKKLSEGASFNFEGIPVGKTVRIEGKFYQTISRGEESYTELLFHGSSAEKQIEYGTNELPISIFRAYADFDIQITVKFPEGTDVNTLASALGLCLPPSDSHDVKALSEACAGGDKLAIYTAAMGFSQSDFYDGYTFILPPGISDEDFYSITINATRRLPISIRDRTRGEEIALVPVFYNDSYKGKYFVSGSLPKVTPIKGQQVTASFEMQKLDIINTATVTWNYGWNSGSGYYYAYYLDDSTSSIDTQGSINSFAFDNEGYFYTIVKTDYESESWYTYIKSNKPGFGSDTYTNATFPNAMKVSTSSDDNGDLLAIDKETNILFLRSGMKLIQITNEDGTGNFNGSCYEGVKEYDFADPDDPETLPEFILSTEAFAVHNGLAYFARTSSDGGTLVIADLNDEPNYYSLKTVSLNLTGMELSSEAEITDMLYQDGYIYMLLNDANTYYQLNSGLSKDYPLHNLGGVIRYNVETETVDNILWSKEALSQDGMGIYAFYQNVNSFDHLLSAPNKSADDKAYWSKLLCTDPLVSQFCPKIYQPASQNKGLYGPRKFIAIKPKKLVIADDGYCFYTDSNGAYCYKNINRIVTVDLETFALASQTVNKSFNGDTINNPLQGSGFKTIWYKDDDPLSASFYKPGSVTEYTEESTDSYVYFYYGFPNGDSE